MRARVTLIRSRGSSRTSVYRKVKRALALSGCSRCPTDECVHNVPCINNEGKYIYLKGVMPLRNALIDFRTFGRGC